MLSVDVRGRFGDFALDVCFAVEPGGITALFGRSGAGKTSVVNLIAGLARPESGTIRLDGRTLFDSAAGIDLPPERRRIGYVFQEGRLFPHLSVAGNLAYGMRYTRGDGGRIAFERVVELLGLGPFLKRRPADLSGGEKQRVAIGRALLTSPRLLAMDEPLASLDAPRKNEIFPFIERLRDELGLTVIYVSHLMEEIVRLADTVVLLSDGQVAAVGPLDEMLSRLDLRPLTGRYEAGSVLAARVESHDEAFGLTALTFPGGELRVSRLDLPVGADLRVRVRARDVALALKKPTEISILNAFAGTVTEIAETSGPQVDVMVDIGVPLWARISARSLHDLGLAVGTPVYALVKAVAIDGVSLGHRGAAAPRNS